MLAINNNILCYIVYVVCYYHLIRILDSYSVWHGEEDIATTTTDAGQHEGTTPRLLSHMFDSDPNSFWHSTDDTVGELKSVSTVFNEPIDFGELVLMKRQD